MSEHIIESCELNINNLSCLLKNLERHWRRLGLQLGVTNVRLNQIEVDFKVHGCDRCMVEMLQHWLDNFNCSWSKIIETLKVIDQRNIADNIFTELLTIRFRNQVFEIDVIAYNLSAIATKWHAIGDALKLSRAKLREIKSEVRDDDDYGKLKKMLSAWKQIGGGHSWKEIIDAVVSVCGYEVISSVPVSNIFVPGSAPIISSTKSLSKYKNIFPPDFVEQFKLLQKDPEEIRKDQEHKKIVLRTKQDLVEFECRLKTDVKHIDTHLRRPVSRSSMKRNQLEELKNGLEDAREKVRSAIATLDSCSELLNQINYDCRVVSDKLNVCKNDLIEFIIQLEFYKAIAKEEVKEEETNPSRVYIRFGCIGGGIGMAAMGVLLGGPVVLTFCIIVGVALGTGVGVMDRVQVDSSSSSGSSSWDERRCVLLLSACAESIDTCIEGSTYSKAQLKTLKDALIDEAHLNGHL